uniref:ABC-2 type transporter transmembrane domain-containing protein n=1 Tax=Fagus sylvatica TaxID=28930 RepID=A0A2N9EID3_FAGSY
MLMETELVLLAKSFIQFDALHFAVCLISAVWNAVLEERRENVLVEVPYLFTQAVLYVIITYPMIGYYWSAYKIFWSFYSMFCTLLYFNYLGMLLVSLTPNVQVASIVASSSYTMLNLFSGFIVPRPVSL